MKKILSAVLAAAMVLSMGVLAFAETTYGVGGTGAKKDLKDANLQWGNAFLYRDDEVTYISNENSEKQEKLRPGDVLYFATTYVDRDANGAPTHKVPKNWNIKISNDYYIDGADFRVFNAANNNAFDNYFKRDTVDGLLFVEVEIKDFEEFDSSKVNFTFYIHDGKQSSDKVKVNYKTDRNVVELTEDDLDWVITVEGPTTYKYVGKRVKAAVLDFDNELAYVEVKLAPDSKYEVASNTDYNKSVAKNYPEADLEFVKLYGDFEKTADVVLVADKDSYIYEVVDDELVAVDAEYVEDYKFSNGTKVDGFLFNTKELGQYAISDVELDLEDAEEPAEGNNSTDKNNPAMGANDFVGAAVALAVVSVAAAGALALKK